MYTPNAQRCALSHFELAMANLTADIVSLDSERLWYVKQQTDQLRNALKTSVVDGANCRDNLQKGAAVKSDNAFAEDYVDIDCTGL